LQPSFQCRRDSFSGVPATGSGPSGCATSSVGKHQFKRLFPSTLKTRLKHSPFAPRCFHRLFATMGCSDSRSGRRRLMVSPASRLIAATRAAQTPGRVSRNPDVSFGARLPQSPRPVAARVFIRCFRAGGRFQLLRTLDHRLVSVTRPNRVHPCGISGSRLCRAKGTSLRARRLGGEPLCFAHSVALVRQSAATC
jgi:hypothetical protein